MEDTVVALVADWLMEFHGEVNDSQVGQRRDYLTPAYHLLRLVEDERIAQNLRAGAQTRP